MGLHDPIDKGMIDRECSRRRFATVGHARSHRNAHLFLVCCGLVFMLGLLERSGGRCRARLDRRVFPERVHDFGVVARGSQVRYTFPVINRTDMEVRILDWKTKCGCTNVRVGSKVIPPGTQTTVEATIDTTRFSGHKASGLTLTSRPPGRDRS